jgi:hypothetical protein
MHIPVLSRCDLRYSYSWFTLGYSDCIVDNIKACNINNEQYKYTSINKWVLILYEQSLKYCDMSISTALSMHRIQTFELSAWLNFAQNRMRSRTTIEDLHWSWKPSYSFSIKFVLHDQCNDELIIIAATTTTETTSTSTTATSKIENDEIYVYNWSMFYCRLDFID